MELTLGNGFVMILCLCLSAFTSPASAKCRGQWAIHACFGGNGKRSDPSQEHNLLQKLIISNAQRLNRMLQNENALPAAEDELIEAPVQYEDDELKAEVEEESDSTQSVRKVPSMKDLRSLLRALRIQQSLPEREASFV
uniref:Ggng 2 n=1 Tax=Deroceras reticulatum TaxID=145610 RepID=A0A1X9WEF1_DERRE|nr:ggng 2 [Deroceras reticulatum]